MEASWIILDVQDGQQDSDAEVGSHQRLEVLGPFKRVVVNRN
jgi:hypothetical protein